VQEPCSPASHAVSGREIANRPRPGPLLAHRGHPVLVDEWRTRERGRLREGIAVALEPDSRQPAARSPLGGPSPIRPTMRTTLVTPLLVAAPPLSRPPSAAALTLRAVGGVKRTGRGCVHGPEGHDGGRISRARSAYAAPGPASSCLRSLTIQAARRVVFGHVLYLIFNEGYAASSGAALHAPMNRRSDPAHASAAQPRLLRRRRFAGLLALMLLTDARGRQELRTDGRSCLSREQRRDSGLTPAIADAWRWSPEGAAQAQSIPSQLQAAISPRCTTSSDRRRD